MLREVVVGPLAHVGSNGLVVNKAEAQVSELARGVGRSRGVAFAKFEGFRAVAMVRAENNG